MEILDVYNRERIKTGETILRGQKHKKDTYHLVVHACIFNSKGEMLIQQRQSLKKFWPKMWDITVGGCVSAGEISQTAIERELLEEIGLKLNLQNMRPQLTINFENGFNDIYLIEQDVNLDELKLQEEEVAQVRWATKEEIFQMIDQGKFISYYKGLIQFLFESRKTYGAFW